MRDDRDPMQGDPIRKEMNLGVGSEEEVEDALEDEERREKKEKIIDFIDGEIVESDIDVDEDENPMLSEFLKFYKCDDFIPYVYWLFELRA